MGTQCNKLSGTIPAQISALVKLESLYAHNQFETLVSVGLCAFSQLFKFFFPPGTSTTMPWRAQSRLKYQHWPSWVCCMPRNTTFYWVFVICFTEYWSCAPLSQPLKRSAFFSSQELLDKRTYWDNPSADICAGQAATDVGPHFFFS